MDQEQVLDAISSEVKGIAEAVALQGDGAKEIKADFDATKADISTINDSVTEQGKRLDEMTSLIEQSGVKGESRERAELEIKYHREFGNLMRGTTSPEKLSGLVGEYKDALIEVATKNGDTSTVQELKAFSTDSLAGGGALVPVRMANSIVEKQRDFSDIRKFATVEKSDTTGLILPGEGADFGFGWVGERETRDTDDDGQFNDVEIPIMEARCRVPITNKMRLNRAFDMDSYITRKAAQRLSRGEGSAFAVGDGFKKPLGMMQYASGTADGQVQQVTTATSNVIAHGDLTDLKTPLRAEYRRNARYLMNRFTQGAIEKLADTAGNPLYNRGDLAKGIADSLKGYPVTLMDDLAGASETDGTFADNALVALFGDLAEFYTIVDHTTSMLMFIDPFTGADDGKVNFRFHKFVGGGVSNFEAAKILKVKPA